MKIKISHGFLLTILALIFTIGLTFVFVELPAVIDNFLHQHFNFVSVATGSGDLSVYKTELYLEHYNLRLIGYICLAVILILIVAGFITNKTGLSSAGAILIFLPAFGHFALTMFFLGGLGMLRLLWMPVLDVSFEIMRLGHIINLPYEILLYIPSKFGLNIGRELPFIIVGTGFLFFVSGTLAWFYNKYQKKGTADFWIYRISRHPQYLGWIILSYGILFLPGSNIKKMYGISGSLPWLLSTMIIIGVAMIEELRMKKQHGDEYEAYCRKTPFLLPLPVVVSRIFSAPLRFMFKRDYPGRKREIAAVLTFYTVSLMILSALFGGFTSPAKIKRSIFPEYVVKNAEELVIAVKNAEGRRYKSYAVTDLANLGEPAVKHLISLLKYEDNLIRQFSAEALGRLKADEAAEPLIELLNDEGGDVRQAAAEALGKIKSEKAVDPLIKTLQDEYWNVKAAAVEALGEIGSEKALDPIIEMLNDEQLHGIVRNRVGTALLKLGSEKAVEVFIAGLKDENWYNRQYNAEALGKTGNEKALQPLIGALNDEHVNVRRSAVLALLEIDSEQVVGGLIKALKDNDFEVRMYAENGLKKIGTPKALKAVKEFGK
ncbi:HEAT repeat domain-containing protein [candidate division KSB1 bacterium]